MSNNDTLASVLSQLDNAVKVGKPSITTSFSSKVIKKVLELMKDFGYIADFEEVEDVKGNFLKINLNGKLNKCGVVKPRFAISINNLERFEKKYLPARGFGVLIISTNQGLMTHNDAKEKNLGGKLISYCY